MLGYHIVAGILFVFFLGISNIFFDIIYHEDEDEDEDEEIDIEEPKQMSENLTEFDNDCVYNLTFNLGDLL
jgi:hypothetical protein